MKYRVVSPEWNQVIADGFSTEGQARNYAEEHCGSWSCWDNIWIIETYWD